MDPKHSLGMMIGAFVMMDVMNTSNKSMYGPDILNPDELKTRKLNAKIKQAKQKGLKCYDFYGNIIFALNDESAYKKAKKKGYLKRQ